MLPMSNFLLLLASVAALAYVSIAGLQNPLRRPRTRDARRYWRLGRQAAVAIVSAGLAVVAAVWFGIEPDPPLLLVPLAVLATILWPAWKRFRASDPWGVSSRS